VKKIIFGIFAHPDDEAFGPSGTLLKLGDEGYDVHLILLTDGDAGVNIDNVPDLAGARIAEWHTSAKLLGATTTHAFHYPDGALETASEADLDEKVVKVIGDALNAYSEPIELAFMTFEPNGLTGHRDHITASQLTTRMSKVFAADEIWYFCLDSTQAPLEGTAYYEPRAREDSYITDRIDVSSWLEGKHHIMDAHISQRHDAEAMKKLGLETERFHIDKL